MLECVARTAQSARRHQRQDSKAALGLALHSSDRSSGGPGWHRNPIPHPPTPAAAADHRACPVALACRLGRPTRASATGAHRARRASPRADFRLSEGGPSRTRSRRRLREERSVRARCRDRSSTRLHKRARCLDRRQLRPGPRTSQTPTGSPSRGVPLPPRNTRYAPVAGPCGSMTAPPG